MHLGSADIEKCFASTSSLTASSSKKSAAKKRSSKSKSSSNGETPSLASVGGRDPALDLFHALGKVLYCKREEVTKPFMTNASMPALLFDPEEVLERAPASPESFTCFLHQNYPTFFSSVDDLASGAEFLSLADQLFVEWTVTLNKNILLRFDNQIKIHFLKSTGKYDLSEYGGLIAVRGLCASNKRVVRQGGMKVFRKPDFYEKRRTCIQRAEQLDYFTSRFQTFGSRAEAATDLIPFISRYR